MKIVWDEPKRLANLDKHGFDFVDVVFFDWEGAVVIDARDGRFKAIGRYVDGTAVVIFAKLGTEAISIISFRAASAREREMLQ